MKTILIISEDGETIATIESCFSAESRVVSTGGIDQGLKILLDKRYDFVFVDLTILRASIQGDDYTNAFDPFRRLYATIHIIVLAPKKMVGEAIKAKLAGADDFMTTPINPAEVKHVTESIQESLILESELDYLRDQFWEKDSLEVIQTKSRKMKELFDKIRSVSPTISAVLLVGETGTGKSLLAKLIHRHSHRRNDQFISVHCGAIPDTLLESELFGHEKGAFTGAIRRKLGKFEIAHGGTIFLDEIGTLTPAAQIKLLQVLQDGTIHRVGGEETIKVDVRVISATNADLGKMCEEGFFRKDLYYRLNVFPIEIPPLREREEDISQLAKGFLKRMNRINTKEVHSIHPKVINALINYSWPGNIRELENLIERAYILETSHELGPESFPIELMGTDSVTTGIPHDPYLSLAQVRKKGIEDIERTYLKELLANNNGRIRTSAEMAGITTRQLHKLMVKYGLRKETFK